MPRNNANAQQMNAQQANMVARQMVVNNAVKRTQQIYTKTVSVANEPVLEVPVRNVGLILGFVVTVQNNIAVAAATGTPLTLTPFGPANMVSEFRFDDFNNNTRIQTRGWHVASVNSARAGSPYLAARSNLSYPQDYGNKFPSLMQAAATIGQDANSNVAMTYFIPCAYSEHDLRGAVYANVTNATAQLRIALNQAMAQARTPGGTVDAVYATANDSTPPADVTIGNVTVNVYQIYYDQLPAGPNGLVLPLLDLSVAYELKNTAIPGIVANQDFPLPYSNYRDYLSTFVLYRNRASVAGGAGWATEADLNYLALESANYTNIYKVPPRLAAAWGRQTVGDDFPLGLYYLPTRARPVSTNQYGNMSVIINAANVQSGAVVLVAYEDFAVQNVVGQAQSLPPA